MANPKVRPYLHFYPEDRAGRPLAEARQAERWLHEIPDDQLTPMARIRQKDYFIHEPAMLADGTTCMPVRWFTRLEGERQVLYAKCWRMQIVTREAGQFWWVISADDLEVHEGRFMKNFMELRADAESIYGIPDPAKILGV